MTHHVQQPRLCDDCETSAQALAETSEPHEAVIKGCPHGAEGVVVAVAAKRGAAIVNWHLEGPLTEEQANVLMARMAIGMAAGGIKAREITRQ
jgi:hypothetical protein